jgi:hypothetical protein
MLAFADPGMAAAPQMIESAAEAQATAQDIAIRPAKAKPKKSDLLIVPIPQSSPSLATGVTAVGALFYNPNGWKEPWTTGGAIMATANGNWRAPPATR